MGRGYFFVTLLSLGPIFGLASPLPAAALGLAQNAQLPEEGFSVGAPQAAKPALEQWDRQRRIGDQRLR